MDHNKDHPKATTAEQFNQQAQPAATPEQIKWLENRRAEHDARHHRPSADIGAKLPFRRLH